MRNLLKISILSAGLLAALAPMGTRAAFTIGNLAVEQLYTNGNSSTFEIVELNPFITNTVPVNTIQIPYTGSSALRQTSAATAGRLALTQDRTLLAFSGAEDPTGVSDETTILPRGVGTVDANGNYILQASYKGVSGDQARGVTSQDDSTWYFADKGGVYTNNVQTTPLNTTNIRPIKCFGGNIYALSENTPSVIVQVTSGGTELTGLPGLPTDASALDFYMFASGSNGTTNDTLYYHDGTTIIKYSLVNGTWVDNGTNKLGVTADGLCAINNGSGAYIYVSTGTGGQVYQITDTAGYNSTISINTNNDSKIYSGAVYLKGIDFAPIPKLYVEQLPNATSNDQQFSLVELNPYLTNAVPVNTIVIPTNGASALRQISNGSSGRLALTSDRTLLAFTGYNDPNGEPGTTSEADFGLRGVGTIDSSAGGDYTLQATYTGIGGSTANQTRSATSLNNSLWYIGDKGGIYTNNTVNPVNTTNVRPIKVFGGTIYVCAATSSSANPAVLDTLSTDATSLTALPGLETTLDANAADFYMIQSGVNGTNYDIAYVSDGATVTKYCLVGGSWTSLGTATLGVTADGFCALNIGGGAQLYVTTGSGAQVVEITDTAGWNEAPVINPADNVVLYAGGAYLKGLEFAPVGGNLTSSLNTPPTITPDPSASVDHPFTNTFTDNVTWRTSITNIQVNGSTLPTAAYNTSIAGEIIFTPSASALLQGAGNIDIVYYATTFNSDQVTQPVAPGAPTGFSIKTQPVAPTGNGGTLVGQPAVAVVDQYGNPVNSSATVTASPGSGSWSFGAASSPTQPLVNGTASFTNLNAFSSAAVPAATISFVVSGLSGLPYTTTNSSAFSIPAPLTGGFTPGYLAVEQVDVASSANSTFSILELNPAVNNSQPVKLFPVPATGTNALRQSGNTGSTGNLADSDDGSLLCFSAGQWSDSTLSDVTTVTNRGAGTFNAQGAYNLPATYQGNGGSTADQPRSAVTVDDTTFYMGDKGGIYTNGENINDAYIPYVATTSPANVRSLKSFGGTVYALQQEGGTDPSSTVIATVPLPGSLATYLVELDGFPLDGNVLDFYALRSGNNGPDYDTIYYIDGTNATAGSIWKWYFTGTSNELQQQVWANAGGSQYANTLTSNGGNGLCAVTNVNGGVDLYYTTGSGDTAGNSVVHAYDANPWNQPINITQSSVIYTAPAGVCLKGIAFAPLPGSGTVPVLPVGSIGSTANMGGISYASSGPSAGLTFSFTNTPASASSFSIWSTTNLLAPFSQWTYLGSPTEASAGTYSFTDASATNNPQTYYRVTSP